MEGGVFDDCYKRTVHRRLCLVNHDCGGRGWQLQRKEKNDDLGIP